MSVYDFALQITMYMNILIIMLMNQNTTSTDALRSITLLSQISTNVVRVHVIQMLLVQILLGCFFVNVCRDLAVMDQRALVCVFNLICFNAFRKRHCYTSNSNGLRWKSFSFPSKLCIHNFAFRMRMSISTINVRLYQNPMITDA